jgi:hypothetical protein
VRLDLSDNPMTEEVAPALAAALAQQPALTALNLNDTSLTDGGVAAVCKALAGAAPKLQARGRAGWGRAGCAGAARRLHGSLPPATATACNSSPAPPSS